MRIIKVTPKIVHIRVETSGSLALVWGLGVMVRKKGVVGGFFGAGYKG